MKKRKLEKEFLDTLRKTHNISRACEVVGLSRNTIYRWRKEDSSFDRKVEEALQEGRDNMNDVMEGKLVQMALKGEFKAISFYLKSNHPKYYQPRDPAPHPSRILNPITAINHSVLDLDDDGNIIGRKSSKPSKDTDSKT